MADDILKSRGRTKGYKLDRGGMPADSGPFIAEIMNNVDPTRNGRVQVYIEEFAKQNKNDPSGWRTVSYLTPYYGKVEHNGTTEGVGTSVGNGNLSITEEGDTDAFGNPIDTNFEGTIAPHFEEADRIAARMNEVMDDDD